MHYIKPCFLTAFAFVVLSEFCMFLRMEHETLVNFGFYLKILVSNLYFLVFIGVSAKGLKNMSLTKISKLRVTALGWALQEKLKFLHLPVIFVQ